MGSPAKLTVDRRSGRLPFSSASWVGPVGAEQQAVHALRPHGVPQMFQVRVVVAVAAVFVLDLHGDDGPAARGLQIHEPGQQLGEPGVNCPLVGGVRAAQRRVLVLEEPGRQPAEVPFRADVRSRPHDHLESDLVRGPYEGGDITPSGEVGLVLGRLVEVPGDVGLHRVQAHRPHPQQPVAPVLGVRPEVVEGAGEDPERLAVQQEFAPSDGQSARTVGLGEGRTAAAHGDARGRSSHRGRAQKRTSAQLRHACSPRLDRLSLKVRRCSVVRVSVHGECCVEQNRAQGVVGERREAGVGAGAVPRDLAPVDPVIRVRGVAAARALRCAGRERRGISALGRRW